ncbi:MAG: IucA/IucC family protein [Methylotenera sp.]
MNSIEASSTYEALSAAHLAGQRSIENLLNCYCREIAVPEGQITVYSMKSDGQQDHVEMRGAPYIHVKIPRLDAMLLVSLEQYSIVGSYRFGENAYYRSPTNKRWKSLTWKALAKLIIDDLSLKFGTPFNIDLFRQVCESNTVSTVIIEQREKMRHNGYVTTNFIDSEQSMVFGHPYHPAPKSRQGFNRQDLREYSPELKVSFALDYFTVLPEFVREQSGLPTKTSELIEQNLNKELPDIGASKAIPVHPWQSKLLLKHPAVRSALKDGSIQYHPAIGEKYFPTSSIRTLYHPNNPYFYKFSLNVRITNCVRKNAHYELESALKINQLLLEHKPDLQHMFPHFTILQEPAFITLDMPHYCNTETQRVEINEGFATILRENVTAHTAPHVTPLVAGALFEKIPHGDAPVFQLLKEMPEARIRSETSLIETWMQSYSELLIKPVLHAYFSYGMIFEPHMQNVVVGIANGLPRQIFLRDFEGVKLVHGRFDVSRLGKIDPAVQKSLYYSDDLGWKRVAYCLFVNHLGEAIGRFGQGNEKLERKLWRIVGEVLHELAGEYGTESLGYLRLQELLSSADLPAKSNLIGRFLKRRDRESSYQDIPNPLRQIWSMPHAV